MERASSSKPDRLLPAASRMRAEYFCRLGCRLAIGAATHGFARRASADPPAAPPIEVTVEADARHPHAAPKDRAVAATVIRRDELEAPGAGAADVLRRVPGLQVSDTGGLGAPATASLRAATAAQTPVYLGGVRLNDEVGGAVDLGTLPLWLIDRVEVYRGHAPIDADRLGIGGAIFLEPVIPTRSTLGVGGMLGSFGSRAAWAHAGSRVAPHSLLLGVRAEAADNTYAFDDDGGTHFVPGDDRRAERQNLDVSLAEVWVLGRTDLDRGALKYLFNHVSREQGVPKLVGNPSLLARAELQRSVAGITSRAWISEDALFEAQTAAVLSETAISDPLLELSLRAPETLVRGERLSQSLALEQRVGRLRLRPAFDISIERLRRYEQTTDLAGAPALVAHRTMSRGSLAVQAHIAGPLHARALGGAQCRATAEGSAAALCDAADPIGRVGASLEFPSWTLYSNIGRYVRVPTLGELYGISLVVRGNPRLEVERALSVEQGARYVLPLRGQIRPLWVDLSAYSRWQSNLISFARSAQGYLVPENVAEGRVAGLELDAGAGFLSHFAIRAALSLVDPRDTTQDRTPHDVLPFQPRFTVSPALEAVTPNSGSALLQRLRAELRLYHRSGYFTDLAGLGVVPAQTWLDFEVSAELLDEHLIARLRAANLLDAERFDIVGFPLPRRSVFLAMEVRY